MADFNNIKNGGVCTPLGFSSAAVCADIKGNGKGKLDLGILLSDVQCNVSAIFTKNKMTAAPVLVSKKLLSESDHSYGILVNSGNANACTGEKGISNCMEILESYEDAFDMPKGSLLISSTGVIGVQIPVDKIKNCAEELVEKIDDEDDDFCLSIMTTDTFSKKIAVLVESDNGSYVIGGTAKGAGMIAPQMATMLSFITTDALVPKAVIDEILYGAVEKSFNAITVDGDMSTNDSVYLFANGMSGIDVTKENRMEQFKKALEYVCTELSKMIVKDGEGATKFVEIKVVNADTVYDAKICAFKIANSPLVKTMFFGEDPNWGRLMATIGASEITLDAEKVDIYFGDLKYVENSTLIDSALEVKAAEIMKLKEYTIIIDLNIGISSFSVYTCDFSYDYVKINADYRS